MSTATRFAISNAKIFDGKRVLPRSTVVVVEDDRIVALLHRVPAGAEVIDATGATLLPGLIDSHIHTSVESLRSTLRFGLTTVIEMGAERTRADRTTIATSDDVSDLRSAGIPLSAPGGHPNQLMLQPGETVASTCHEHGQLFPAPSGPQEAVHFVNERIREGSDFIKVLLDDGSTTGESGLPVPSRETLAAAIDEAHRQAKIVVAHALTLDATAELIDLGVDGLAHIFLDRPHTPEIIASIAQSTGFVIPCLVLNRSITGTSGEDIAADPRVSSRLEEVELEALRRTFNTFPQGHYREVVATVAALHDANVPLLAGTDASLPIPRMGGLAQGASLHHELQLLVEAGLTPLEALACATSAPAHHFGLIDRGRIAPGMRADLLLVDGDPLENIADTLSIRSVWRRGVRLAPRALDLTFAEEARA